METAMMRKDLKFRAKCNMKILERHLGVDVMLDLTDFIMDVFVESLRSENPNITEHEIKQKMKELVAWKRGM
jgi:hypothetical protein